MKVRALAVCMSLCWGSTLFAMPAVDGKYKCSSQGETVEVEFRTEGAVLKPIGLSLDGSDDLGLVCENKSTKEDGAGGTLRTLSACDETSLTVARSLEADEYLTKLLTTVTVKKDSDTQLTLTVNMHGKLMGDQVSESIPVVCTKLAQ